MRRSQLFFGTLLLGLAACSAEPTAPRQAPDATLRIAAASASNDPVFVRAATGSPAVANPVVSFWARADQTRDVTMSYADGARLMYFKVPKGGLLALPDGTPLAGQDSVLITATLTDATHLIVDFQPSGLRFTSKKPATLKLYYLHTDPDLNGDGVVNATDSKLVSKLRIWKRETSSAPWFKLASVVNATIEEVEASIFGFTSYGIAY